MHEEFWRGSINEAIAHYTNFEPRGEFTLVIAGGESTDQIWTEIQLITELESLLAEGVSRSQASRQLAELTNLPRRQIYQLALTINPD